MLAGQVAIRWNAQCCRHKALLTMQSYLQRMDLLLSMQYTMALMGHRVQWKVADQAGRRQSVWRRSQLEETTRLLWYSRTNKRERADRFQENLLGPGHDLAHQHPFRCSIISPADWEAFRGAAKWLSNGLCCQALVIIELPCEGKLSTVVFS